MGLESEIWKETILDPRLKKAPDPGSATLSTVTIDVPIFPFTAKGTSSLKVW
jgi:hypothetical protein